MQRGGDPLILCFVDFVNAACAATAMSALQGDHFTFLQSSHTSVGKLKFILLLLYFLVRFIWQLRH